MRYVNRRRQISHLQVETNLEPQGSTMSNIKNVFGVLLLVAAATIGVELNAAPASISTFPYTPNDTAEGDDFEADYGSDPSADGSTWTHDTVDSPRLNDVGDDDPAWAVLPDAAYANDTVTWLHSPIFDFSGESGLEMAFEMWVRTRDGVDGLKLQVSDDGGDNWSDVSGVSVAYNSENDDIQTTYGGEVDCWSGTEEELGGDHSTTCIVNLNPWAGETDVRFRWCFYAGNDDDPLEGAVIDSVRIVAVSSTVAYSGGYTAVPQGKTVSATITKTGGDDFVTGMTVNVQGTGVTGTVTSVTSVDECEVSFTATRTADVGGHIFWIEDGSTNVCQGTVQVYYPQQQIPTREIGSTQEPPRNGTIGGNGVYLHSGEFRHDLPIFSIPGRMLPLGMGITYRSQMDTMGPVGTGWFASWDKRLYYSSGADEITIYSGSGRIDTFELKSGGTAGEGPYVAEGFFLEIDRDDNSTSGTETDDEFTIRYAHGSESTLTSANKDTAGVWVFRETEFSDRYGNKIQCTWNDNGQLTRMLGDMYNAGTSTTRYAIDFEYGDDGRLEKITDYADYTAQQSVVGTSYTGNREWEFVYDSDARLTEIRLPKTQDYYSDTKGSTYRTRVQFTYDSNDNLLEVIDARQANETTPLGWLKNHYDGNGDVDYQDVGRTSAADTTHRQHIVYDSATDVSVVNAEQHRSQYLLNANGTLDEVKHYTGTWDTDATVISATPAHAGDPAHFRTQYEYDTEFHVTKVTYPRGNTTEFRYDITATDRRSRGNLLRVLSRKGTVSPHLLPSDQEHGLLAKFTYTTAAQFNLLKTSINPRAFELKSTYNITTDLAADYQRDDSSDYTTTNHYFFSHGTYPDGTLEKTVTPTVDDTIFVGSLNDNQYLQTEFTYNSYGQVITSEDQAGVETTFVYGASGFDQGYLTEVKVGTQPSVTPLVTEFTYNSVGRAITVEDAKNETYTSYVNQLDQVIKSETPQVSAQMSGGSAATYYTKSEYDLNGNLDTFLVSNIDENGTAGSPSEIETAYAYNILDLATSVTEDIDASTTRTTSFTYDKIFRLTETELPESNKSGTDYDELNRAFKSYFGYGGGVAKASALITSEVFYDDNSNVTKAVDGRGNDSHYTFDAYDRMTKAEDRLATNPNYTEYTYNQAGQAIEITRKGHKRYWNGSAYAWATYGSTLSEVEYKIDNIGRVYMTKVLAQDAGTSNLGYSSLEGATNYETGWATSRVKFRNNGQVERVRDDLGYETGYEYDDYNRLKRVIDDRDDNDPAGPSTSDDDNYDEYAYDANGNITSVTAHLYDDRGASGDKTLTTTFAYDEINRLKSDTSPSVTTLDDSGTLTTGTLTREFKYDSRSNLVRTYDRKEVERKTKYDLLNRPIRHTITDVTQRTINSSGYVSTVTHDIVSRTVYDKNSNVTQSIDPYGNRTYMRYDLAERWLQTQHPDGGTGTPLKTTAGSGHTVTAVGSTVFYSKSGAYDGNSNLLTLTDENDTEIDFTYDENDLLTDEDGTAGSGNPFNIEGEAGMEYLYDGLYRSVYGKTHDGTNTLTEVDSVFNTLSGLERQRQRIKRAHPNDTGFDRELTLYSKFDESGRRYQRTNPSGLTRVTWDFDRKHRPTEEQVEAWDSGNSVWGTAQTVAEYEYLGGGLLHSRQTRTMWQDVGGVSKQFDFISNFDRDNLLRLTKVRHYRDDTSILYGDRLIGRYEYAYNENSMMGYEARWYHNDSDGTSTTPDESDLYFYDSVDRLEKAVYGATKYTSSGTTITSALIDDAYADFGDDTDHAGTFIDRIYYARRKTGTRSKVNWYRGASSGSSSALAARNDTNSAPEQTTNYSTNDDETADPDNPVSDGEGSRHNYTVIGQVTLDYDKRRNVIADATREFRYNYRNQLRRVIRKSDDADISKYREDAYGRRVQAVIEWELGRRVYFDTRFELDVIMDDDNDSTDMKYVDGGITSDDDPGPGLADQIAAWPSRLDKTVTSNDTHYFDFHVDIPDVGGSSSTYLGFVAYEQYEVRIYGNRYELWTTGGGSAIASYTAPASNTRGRHNIGIKGGNASGIFIDGVTAMTSGPTIITSPEARFGTHDIDPDLATSEDGLVLLECLTYFKSFEINPGGLPGDPRVSLYFFDGPQVVTEERVKRPTVTTTTYMKVDAVSPTQQDTFDTSGNRAPRIMLPNGRRTTGHVIERNADSFVNNEGTIQGHPGGETLPGVSHTIVTDGTGAVRTHGRTSASTDPTPGLFLTTNNPGDGLYIYSMVSVGHGPYSGPEPTFSTYVGSDSLMVSIGALGDALSFGDGLGNSGGRCACRCENPSKSATTTSYVSTDTALRTNALNNYSDIDTGLQLGVAPLGGNKIQLMEWDVGWDPGDTWKALGKLSKTAQEKLQALLDGGWKIATSSDGTTSIGKLKDQHDNVRIDVDDEGDDGWIDWFMKGNDGQWKDGSWGISFESKLIYIDENDDDVAASVLHYLMSRIRGKADEAADNISKADFHSDTKAGDFWQACGDMVGPGLQAKTLDEIRIRSQLSSMRFYGMLDVLLDAFSAQYGLGIFVDLILGGGVAAGLTAAVKFKRLFEVLKNLQLYKELPGRARFFTALGKFAKNLKRGGKMFTHKGGKAAAEAHWKALTAGYGDDVVDVGKGGKRLTVGDVTYVLRGSKGKRDANGNWMKGDTTIEILHRTGGNKVQYKHRFQE